MCDVEQAIAGRRVEQYRAGGVERRSIIAQARRQVERAVEEEIVDDVRFVENARATADYGLAVTSKIPGEAGLRGEKIARAINLPGQVLAELRQLWRTRQIVVGKVAVEIVTQPQIEREVALNLPGVLRIQTEAVVEEATVRQVVRRLLAAETQAVAEHELTEWEIERIVRSTKPDGVCYGCCGKGGADARRIFKETREAALRNVVRGGAEAEGMVSSCDAAVVFYLLVVLKGRLRSVRVRADCQLVLNVDQDWLACGVERCRCPGLRIRVHNEVVEVEIAVAQRMSPARGVVVNAYDMGIGVVEV